MSEDIKKTNEDVKEPNPDFGFKIVGGYVGRYAMSLSNKLYYFEFPVENSLEDNLTIIEHLKDELVKSIQVQKEKKEQEAKEKDSKDQK